MPELKHHSHHASDRSILIACGVGNVDSNPVRLLAGPEAHQPRCRGTCSFRYEAVAAIQLQVLGQCVRAPDDRWELVSPVERVVQRRASGANS